MRATDDGYAADIDVVLDADASHTSRTLESDECEVLARAAAVIIAVGLDPIAVATTLGQATAKTPEPTTTDDAPEPEPAPELATRGPAVSEDTSATPTRPPPRLEYGVGVGTGVGGLLLPEAGIGVSIAPFVGTRHVHVQTVAQYWLPRQVALDDSRDVRAALQMATAGVRVCPLLSWGRLRLELCAGIDAGAVFGRGRGADLEAKRVATDPWAGVLLAPGVRLAVAPRLSVGWRSRARSPCIDRDSPSTASRAICGRSAPAGSVACSRCKPTVDARCVDASARRRELGQRRNAAAALRRAGPTQGSAATERQ